MTFMTEMACIPSHFKCSYIVQMVGHPICWIPFPAIESAGYTGSNPVIGI